MFLMDFRQNVFHVKRATSQKIGLFWQIFERKKTRLKNHVCMSNLVVNKKRPSVLAAFVQKNNFGLLLKIVSPFDTFKTINFFLKNGLLHQFLDAVTMQPSAVIFF